MKKHVVMGLDGVPYSLLSRMFREGVMPFLKTLSEENYFKEINSSIPPVSSVAWTNYATGENPAAHNIYGFVDRVSNPFNLILPDSRTRKSDTLWKKLSKAGKKVIVMNVPLTYPPEPVNGILVSCFLCPNIEKGTYPKAFARYLKEKDYVIDADADMAKTNLEKFLEELFFIMRKRFEIAQELLVKETWDYFHLHIMETDRLMHFLWNAIEEPSNQYHERVLDFFHELDGHIMKIFQLYGNKAKFTLLSDHGFCGIKYEVQMNKWLEQEGLLHYKTTSGKTLLNYASDSKCYALIPGRFYINVKGREENGCVSSEEYESIRQELKNKLLQFKSPLGENVIQEVYYKEEIYEGDSFANAPDLVAIPENGYDLKARVECSGIFENSHLTGMHTYNDAFLLTNGYPVDQIDSIESISRYIYKEIVT